MINKLSSSYRRAFILFVLVIVVFMVIADALIISFQRRSLSQEAQDDLKSNMDLVEIFVREPILRHDYSEVEQFLQYWAEDQSDIVEVNAVMPNGYVLVNYVRDEPAAATYKYEKKMSYFGSDLVTLEVVKDFDPVDRKLSILRFQHIAQSLFLTGLFGLIIWFVMKKFAISPLEAEIERRRHLEELLEEAMHGLEAKVRERTDDLQQIIYTVSHDLRSPLVNVDGYHKEIGYSLKELEALLSGIELPQDAKEKMASIIDKDITEAMVYIDGSIARMDSLLFSLLQISRATRADLQMQELDMNSLVYDVLNTFDFQINKAGAKVEVKPLPSCIGDESQINQVFSNLISNALKYHSPERPLLLNISGKKEAGDVVYCVEDNGIGIIADEQAKIFDLFNRLHPQMGKGEGIGLNIVSKILEKHGGRIWVESEVGKGSKFYVQLKCANA